MRKRILTVLLALVSALMLTACAGRAQGAPVPQSTPERTQIKAETVHWPADKLTLNNEGVPELRVYVTEEKAVQTMDVERYTEGVLAAKR